jgi:hypothetical protein
MVSLETRSSATNIKDMVGKSRKYNIEASRSCIINRVNRPAKPRRAINPITNHLAMIFDEISIK